MHRTAARASMAVNTGAFPDFPTAAYILPGGKGHAAIVGSIGTADGTHKILKVLHRAGYSPSDLRLILPTSGSFLDSSGCTALMKACPMAEICAPSAVANQLLRPDCSTVQHMFGQDVRAPVAVDEKRLRLVEHQELLSTGELQLEAGVPTGGHAAFFVERNSRKAFVGDAVGASYPPWVSPLGSRLLLPSGSVDFEPKQRLALISTIADYEISGLMISRYSQLSEPEDAVSKARRGILFLEAIAVQAHRMHMQQDMLNEFLENKIESWCHDEASRLKFVWAESMQDLAKLDVLLISRALSKYVQTVIDRSHKTPSILDAGDEWRRDSELNWGTPLHAGLVINRR